MSFFPQYTRRLIVCLMMTSGMSLFGQVNDTDVQYIRSIYDYSLTTADCYHWLDTLCHEAGPRLAGSNAYDRATELVTQYLNQLEGVNVEQLPCTVKVWKRGKKAEIGIYGQKIELPKGFKGFHAVALGNSIPTPKEGIIAPYIEVKSLDEVEALGEAVRGKIVFYNRPMDPKQIRTFSAYGGAGDQRVHGPSKAAKYGAVAVIVRSLTTLEDDAIPHSGTLVYAEGAPKIPAFGISTNLANHLSTWAKEGKNYTLKLVSDCSLEGTKTNYSVIAEWKGSTEPDKIILVGGHLDAWDLGQGAHDDGAGCVQAMQVLATLQHMGYKPKHTIRCVLFANEENGLAGGLSYAAESKKKGEFHLAAIESDAGGFTPRGFAFEADTSILKTAYKYVSQWQDILDPYGIRMELGGGGADISPLKYQKGLLAGLRPDSQRYFDLHHTVNDTFDHINKRELELGAAAMTALVYLIDQYEIGLPSKS